jgi:hypothetical protein
MLSIWPWRNYTSELSYLLEYQSCLASSMTSQKFFGKLSALVTMVQQFSVSARRGQVGSDETHVLPSKASRPAERNPACSDKVELPLAGSNLAYWACGGTGFWLPPAVESARPVGLEVCASIGGCLCAGSALILGFPVQAGLQKPRSCPGRRDRRQPFPNGFDP